MSMLTAQVENLRIMARLVRDYDYREISRELREAADTIENLRMRLTEQTCHMELLPDEPTTSIQPMRCTACGHKTYAQLANYCPNCGAEVVV